MENVKKVNKKKNCYVEGDVVLITDKQTYNLHYNKIIITLRCSKQRIKQIEVGMCIHYKHCN